jgi:hypothetical protein
MESNVHIVQRLLELAKNPLEYSTSPKHFKKEHMFLSNVLSDSLRKHEDEFAKAFKYAVGTYKSNLAENKEYGWFNDPSQLEFINTYINQLKYAIYGDQFERKLKFNNKLGKEAYKDFICQIDRTVLMTPKELEKHNKQVNKIAGDILAEILKESKAKE